MATPEITQLNREIRQVRRGLRAAGIPVGVLDAVSTRALRSGRRQTGAYRSNRASRWKLDAKDPQFGTEADCKRILLRLLGMMLDFKSAPTVDDETRKVLEQYVDAPIAPGTYRDALTKELLDFQDFLAEPTPGRSNFHIGHVDPTATPRHTPGNVSWRSARSNLIQGDLTLPQARTKFVELIARYFDLGEVHIEPD